MQAGQVLYHGAKNPDPQETFYLIIISTLGVRQDKVGLKSTLWMIKLRPREVKWPAQEHSKTGRPRPDQQTSSSVGKRTEYN